MSQDVKSYIDMLRTQTELTKNNETNVYKDVNFSRKSYAHFGIVSA